MGNLLRRLGLSSTDNSGQVDCWLVRFELVRFELVRFELVWFELVRFEDEGVLMAWHSLTWHHRACPVPCIGLDCIVFARR